MRLGWAHGGCWMVDAGWRRRARCSVLRIAYCVLRVAYSVFGSPESVSGIPGQPTCDAGDEEVARGGHPKRGTEAQRFDQNQRREQSSDGSSEDVRKVQVTEAVSVLRLSLPNMGHHQGEGGAHEQAPGQNGHRQNQGRERQIRPRVALAGCQQQILTQGKQFWNRDRPQADHQLRHPVESSRRQSCFPRQRTNRSAARPCADGQSQHKYRDHHRKHRSDDAERGEGEARPYHLINQTAKARHKEHQEQNWALGGRHVRGRLRKPLDWRSR